MSTYQNPVFPEYFADPFVLEHGGTYYAYGTSPTPGPGGVFPVLISMDLVHWTPAGAVVSPVDGWSDYWAPEVAEQGGQFYLYFSAGRGDQGHHLRVAVAASPLGPFVDQGRTLTPALPFAIDPSPFRDDDGTWYLYYATDMLEGERVGTSLVVQRLSADLTNLEGEVVTVLRASHDWQRYQAGRSMYGAVYDWHTLEGPCVVHRHGQYYCLYSGGAWTQQSYGVSYAVAMSPLGPWTEPYPDAPQLLRTVPGHVIGPGHNSLVRGPDGQDVVVYHAWDVAQSARRLCVDRLTWEEGRPVLQGPTWTPQPAFSR